MEIAKVFSDDKGRALRLPESCAFMEDEVLVNRIGSVVVLVPRRAPWSSMIESLDLFTDDFMADGRGELKLEEREAL